MLPQSPSFLCGPAVAANAAAGGTCGENVTWELNNGVLTISGEGAMEDYTSYTMPFAGLDFSKAVISEGVTSDGNSACYHCDRLTEVTIPESVTSIGSLAFSGTPWLAAKKTENPLVAVKGMLIDGTACSGGRRNPEQRDMHHRKCVCILHQNYETDDS